MTDWLPALEKGDARAVAKLITLLEDGSPEARDVMRRLHPRTGRAHTIGVTGAPGTGKSTLADKMIAELRDRGKTVGVIAVDPSSPFTGGAILGDRIRMQSRALDPGVFIRSMGSRGALGGISGATRDAVAVLDAAGKDVVLVETVGVGQGEVDVVKTADTVVLLTAPSLGDDIQAVKAGIMEIGDVFVVNKSDLAGADTTAMEIETMLGLAERAQADWLPPVLTTCAAKGTGAKDVLDACGAHLAHLRTTGLLETRRREKRELELMDILKSRLVSWVLDEEKARERLHDLAERVARRELDPYTAAERLLERFQG